MNGNDLPCVESATHIGHEIHQMCNMDYDTKTKRAKFINNSVDILDIFSFAHPDQVLKAINLYCGHCYGSMLWDLSSECSGKFFRSWNTSVKLAWKVPRSTHTYFVNHFLAANHLSFREQLLIRYVKFFQKLLKSKSAPVQLLANIVARDIRSTTGRNLQLIEKESGLDPWTTNGHHVKEALQRTPVPAQDMWRLPLLNQFLTRRHELEALLEDTQAINDLIDSLCSS